MRTSTAAATGLLTAVLASCGGGGATGSTSCTAASPSPAGPPTVSAGPLSAAVDRTALPAGATLHLQVVATGPVAYTAPCDAPLQLLVIEDAGDIHVDTPAPPAAHGVACGSVHLEAGQRAEYDTDWTPDETLPAGLYRTVLTLGDQPPLILRVALGTSPVAPSCGR